MSAASIGCDDTTHVPSNALLPLPSPSAVWPIPTVFGRSYVCCSSTLIVRVRAMQAGQTRSCGVRAHTHKHPRTEMPAVGSHATCAAALPSGSPPDPSSLSTHFRTVENCQPSNPTNFGLVFRSPRTLRVCGDLMSNISMTLGRLDMRFCVCGSPSEDLSHIASLTIGCSR